MTTTTLTPLKPNYERYDFEERIRVTCAHRRDALDTAALLGLPSFLWRDDDDGEKQGYRLGKLFGRVLHVSASGMTRDIQLGYAIMRDGDERPDVSSCAPSWSRDGAWKIAARRAPMGGPTYRVSGCGMDMVFHLASSMFEQAKRMLGVPYEDWPYQKHLHCRG